jgi:hypothetical protein
MNAIQEMRETRQKLRDKAAHHARLARQHEQKANGAEHQNWYQLYRTEASNHYAQYRAFRWASSSVFHAMRRAEMHEKKSQAVNTLRAMG